MRAWWRAIGSQLPFRYQYMGATISQVCTEEAAFEHSNTRGSVSARVGLESSICCSQKVSTYSSSVSKEIPAKPSFARYPKSYLPRGFSPPSCILPCRRYPFLDRNFGALDRSMIQRRPTSPWGRCPRYRLFSSKIIDTAKIPIPQCYPRNLCTLMSLLLITGLANGERAAVDEVGFGRTLHIGIPLRGQDVVHRLGLGLGRASALADVVLKSKESVLCGVHTEWLPLDDERSEGTRGDVCVSVAAAKVQLHAWRSPAFRGSFGPSRNPRTVLAPSVIPRPGEPLLAGHVTSHGPIYRGVYPYVVGSFITSGTRNLLLP